MCTLTLVLLKSLGLHNLIFLMELGFLRVCMVNKVHLFYCEVVVPHSVLSSQDPTAIMDELKQAVRRQQPRIPLFHPTAFKLRCKTALRRCLWTLSAGIFLRLGIFDWAKRFKMTWSWAKSLRMIQGIESLTKIRKINFIFFSFFCFFLNITLFPHYIF